MKLLIIGGSGMLGHRLWLHFRQRCETWVTLRRPPASIVGGEIFHSPTVVVMDASDEEALKRLFERVGPDVVLNCVGIVKQLKEAKDPILSIEINALLPHRLARLCQQYGSKLVHFSTDCVFSGSRGYYSESDHPDPVDLYGRTKLLGEVTEHPHVLTLRSSIIGRELGSAHSLVDWFLSQSGKEVRGYNKAIYSGVTTLEMARVVDRAISGSPWISGLWHLASAPIAKHDLLMLIKSAFDLDIKVTPDDAFVCNRSLNAERFNSHLNYTAPTWPEMIQELAANGI